MKVIYNVVDKHYTPFEGIKTSRKEAVAAVDSMLALVIGFEKYVGMNNQSRAWFYLTQINKELVNASERKT